MGTAPRHHHFVTKAYLEGFLEPPAAHLLCYGRKRSAPFRSAPEKLANIRDFHSFRRPDGTIDASLEAYIGREIETPGIPVLRKLAAGRTAIDHIQRLKLAKLVALQSVRVPFERNFMDENNKEDLLSYLAQMDEDSRRLNAPVNAIQIAITPVDDPRLIKKWFTLTRAQVLAALNEVKEDPTGSSRKTFLGLADAIAEIYMSMEWTIHCAQGSQRFITSDRPVLRHYSDGGGPGRGLKDLRSEVYFPLSSAALFHMKHHNWLIDEIRKRKHGAPRPRRRPANPTIACVEAEIELMEKVNRMLADHAHLWVFSGREEEWLSGWMKEPFKKPKRAVTVADEERYPRTGHEPPKLTRKREFVVAED
jgi:hypothetical protein